MRPILLFVIALALPAARSHETESSKLSWRPATSAELRRIIPERAPVVGERIETEFRTSSGIRNSKGKFIVGVVLITAGYSADGKFSHFLMVQAPMQIGDFTLEPGNYVFGYQRRDDSLQVLFYEAQSGKFLGEVKASRTSTIGKIESFHLFAPAEKSAIQLGRFAFPYRLDN